MVFSGWTPDTIAGCGAENRKFRLHQRYQAGASFECVDRRRCSATAGFRPEAPLHNGADYHFHGVGSFAIVAGVITVLPVVDGWLGNRVCQLRSGVGNR